MFKNYLKTILRNIRRQKGFSFVNVVSLAIGLTCFILILIFVRYEFSYDRYHKNAEHIYRVLVGTNEYYLGKNRVPVTPAPLAAAVKEELPDVLKVTMIRRGSPIIKHGNDLFKEAVFYVNEDFLEIFSFPLISGDTGSLNKPYSMLITQSMAEKYFGQENPLGKILRVSSSDYTVTGVLKDVPQNTHFRFDFLTSFSTLIEREGEERFNNWNNWSYYTYFLLNPQADPLLVQGKLRRLLKKYNEEAGQNLYLQPITDIHLYTKANFELGTNADIRTLYLLSAIALFILLTACFNYMNLSTARASQRAKEVGMRKVVGAARLNLVKQFLGESLFFTLSALAFSLILVKLLLPVLGNFVDRSLDFSLLGQGWMPFLLMVILLSTGLAAGAYPALVLSSFRPVVILKGIHKITTRGSSSFRNFLVAAQFIISIVLIFSSLMIYKQLHYIHNKELGFSKEHIMTVPFSRDNPEPLRRILLQNPRILDAAASSDLPSEISSASFGEWEGKKEDTDLLFYRLWTDYNYLDFYKISFIAGRNFSQDFNDKENKSFILNEAAVKAIGWKDPIGQRFGFDKDNLGTVIGVIKDFHFAPLHLDIEPLAISVEREEFERLSMKISSKNVSQVITFVEEKWKGFFPDTLFRYSFLDDRIDRMYRTEYRLGKILNAFTLIAILVACLGLFGLASFTAEQRTKEIGIRKVLGATVPHITVLLTRDYLRLILFANLIALPVAYYAMSRWLQSFAYRTSMSPWILAASSLLTFLIALLTVSYQAVKAAVANPADSLRYE